MSKRHRPPTRISISLVSILKPAGPNQIGRCFRSVQAVNTMSRRASITRERTISRSSAHCESVALVDEDMINSFDWDGHVTVVSMTLSNSLRSWPQQGALPLAEPFFPGLLLDCLHINLEPIQASLPNRTLRYQPTFSIGHGSWLQSAGANTPTLLGFHETDVLKHPDVLHKARQRHVERLGEFSDRGFALAQTLKDRSSCWVGKSAEDKVETR